LIVHAAVAVCSDCGYVFPPPEKGTCDETASNEGILTGEITDTEYDVMDVIYCVHVKRGAGENDPRTVRVDYQVGFNEFKSEWVCPEHNGWAQKKFEKWWQERSSDPVPTDADLAVRLANAGGLAVTNRILVRKVGGEKFDRVIRHSLGEKPPAVGETVDQSLCENCVNGCYDNDFSIVCKLGLKAGGPCLHFDGVTECDANSNEIPF